MTVATVAMGIAMLLAVIGLVLNHRSRRCSRLYPIRRGRCPHCQEVLWLPLRICPLCGTKFGDELYRKVMVRGREEVKRRERVLLRSSQIFILLAWMVLFSSLLIERAWP